MGDLLTFGKVAAVFVAVVFAMKKRAPMGPALSAGGIAIALLMMKSPAWIGRELAGGVDAVLFTSSTGNFVAVLGMISALAYVLQNAGQIGRLTGAFGSLSRSPKLTMAALPAIIGLLPMPGGALISAPMVEASANGTGLEPEDKALINYWYRHVWEYAWPLFSAVLLAAQLSGVEVRKLALLQSPLCLAGLGAGLIFLARVAGTAAPAEASGRRKAAFDVAVVLLPVVAVFALHLAAGLDLLFSVSVGLGAACLWHLAAGNIRPGALLRSLFANKGVLDMMLMAYGAKVFGELMVRSGAIGGISSLFQSMHMPVVLLAFLLPLTVGFFGGMTIVAVMTTFPVLLAFPGVAAHPTPVMTFAFAAASSGVLLSPVHSCFAVSALYFRSDPFRLLRRLLVPQSIVIATGAALMLLYQQIYR